MPGQTNGQTVPSAHGTPDGLTADGSEVFQLKCPRRPRRIRTKRRITDQSLRNLRVARRLFGTASSPDPGPAAASGFREANDNHKQALEPARRDGLRFDPSHIWEASPIDGELSPGTLCRPTPGCGSAPKPLQLCCLPDR